MDKFPTVPIRSYRPNWKGDFRRPLPPLLQFLFLCNLTTSYNGKRTRFGFGLRLGFGSYNGKRTRFGFGFGLRLGLRFGSYNGKRNGLDFSGKTKKKCKELYRKNKIEIGKKNISAIVPRLKPYIFRRYNLVLPWSPLNHLKFVWLRFFFQSWYFREKNANNSLIKTKLKLEKQRYVVQRLFLD